MESSYQLCVWELCVYHSQISHWLKSSLAEVPGNQLDGAGGGVTLGEQSKGFTTAQQTVTDCRPSKADREELFIITGREVWG